MSRAGFYRSLQEAQPVEEAMMVRAEIQAIALTPWSDITVKRWAKTRKIFEGFREPKSTVLESD